MTSGPIVSEVEGGRPIKAWVRDVEFEPKAKLQVENVAKLPFIHKHVAVMPDVHYGLGATVGSVIATKGAIIPAAVGVDLGCGVIATRTGLTASQLPDNLAALRSAIEKAVPHGRTNDGKPGDRGAWGTPPALTVGEWDVNLKAGYAKIVGKHPKISRNSTIEHLGTLGTGNHFIEVCLDEAQRVWVMLHSGSRGVGGRIGMYFIEKAKEDMRRWFINVPDVDLAYLPEGTEHFDDYIEAVHWAQEFARTNRALMMQATLAAMVEGGLPVDKVVAEETAINCFAFETPVLTENGVFTIGSLAGQRHRLLTEGGDWVVAPIRSFGRQELMKVTLCRSGVVKVIHATPGHEWVVSPAQRKLSFVCRTDKLVDGYRLATAFPRRVSSSPDPLGVARGFVFGDGSTVSKNTARASFCGDKDTALIPMFTETLKIGNAPRRYSNATVITGLPIEWKVSLPDLGMAPDLLYGWLAGYFAADGDVDETGRPTLASAVRSHLVFVRHLCTRLGIGTFGIRSRLRSGFGEPPSALYMLGLMRNDLDESFFFIPAHRARFVATGRVAERRAWRVASVESTDRYEEVFCAVVEPSHSFALEDNILVRNCHHNYISRESHFGENVLVTRKGAVRARKSDLGVIPGSMGAKSFIVRGLGNEQSFHSCSHGAGRRMSRTEARKTFSVADHVEATKGIECRKDADVIDETPMSYKSIDAVMLAQADLVEVAHTLRQVLCVKG
jgi:RNA-splicing ligase RtcB